MLYLWMPEANGVWQWSRGECWNQAQSLEQLIQEIKIEKGEEAVVFFPSRDVQIIQQNLSKTQYKQLGADGVKYLLEEYVIQPIDQMKVFSHFQQPNQVSILGVAHHMVLTMQHALSLIPVKVIALLPEFLLLPIPIADEVILVNMNGRVLVRENEFLGYSVDDLAVYLEFSDHQKTYKYSDLNEAQFASLSAMTTSDTREQFNYSLTEISRAKAHPYNVLPKAKQDNAGISRYWQACAVLLVAVLVVQFSYDVLRWVKLKKIADQTAVMAISDYKSWFGDVGRVTEQNLRSVFEGNLRASQNGNTQVLQLLSRIGPILMQQQIIANRVSYETDVLNMDLIAQSSDQLNRLVQQLNQQGFKAELGNVKTQGVTVVGMVKIQ